MHKVNFANRLGLVASFFLMSLFPTTSAWAQKTTGTAAAQGPQQVIVTNTAGQPVPVAVQGAQYFQATQSLGCAGCLHLDFTFNVPSGKKLLIRSVNVYGGSYNNLDDFGAVLYADDGSTGWLMFGMPPVGGGFSSFAVAGGTNQSVQLLVTNTAHASVRRGNGGITAFSATMTISGELVD
jgi:hypothetical protein